MMAHVGLDYRQPMASLILEKLWFLSVILLRRASPLLFQRFIWLTLGLIFVILVQAIANLFMFMSSLDRNVGHKAQLECDHVYKLLES